MSEKERPTKYNRDRKVLPRASGEQCAGRVGTEGNKGNPEEQMQIREDMPGFTEQWVWQEWWKIRLGRWVGNDKC